MSKEKLYIFDTTLRDGAQTEGVDFSVDDKNKIAKVLSEIGIDYIEGGWPGANPVDTEFFSKPLSLNKSIFTAFGMTKKTGRSAENDPSLSSLINASCSAICVVGKAWDFHVKTALEIKNEDNLENIRETAKHIIKNGKEFLFDAEHFFDGFKSNPEYALDCLKSAYDQGARWLVLCDTNGGTLPHEVTEIVSKVTKTIPGKNLGIHAHNDTENAVANSLAAIQAGVRQVQGTINGLGERAGNAALEEVVMAMKVRSDLLKVHTSINSEAISKTSKLVSSITGFPVQPNKAIVGANAFAHESGIHQDGVLKNVETYEIMSPESIGLKKSSLVLGKHSGKHAFKEKLKILGYEVGDNFINEIFTKFKQLADKKKDVYDEDIIALVDDTHINQINTLKLINLSIMSGTNSKHVASLELDFKGEVKEVSGSGNGPVDAVFSCIAKVVNFSPKLKLYNINAITPDSDAQGEVAVKLEHFNKEFIGKASDIDIIVASAKSYINAVNKILNFEKNSNMQEGVSEISISNMKGI